MAKRYRTPPSSAAVRFGGAAMLLMAVLIGSFCVPALPYASGLAGKHGTLTVDGYKYSYSSRGGTTRSSQGTFRSDDGRTTDPKAVVEPEYALGRRVTVTRAPWTYYVVGPACFLGWLAGTCFAACFLVFGAPALVFGARWSDGTRAGAVRVQVRIAVGAFYGAVGVGGLAVAFVVVA
ncbi:hypothetical protein AB0A70_25335 [Streptomyces morookaense]|uniref:hypothetical protein n=1 Tax=Streptomyces morookaense TaxID=1970 RepID=UPI0033F64A80